MAGQCALPARVLGGPSPRLRSGVLPRGVGISSDAIQRVLADAAWAARSPALWGEVPPLASELAFAVQEEDAASLATHRRVPIGRYFERLVEAWLCSANVGSLVANTPIRDGGATLGELDLVFKASGKAMHWELAVKFYLGLGDLTASSSWHGPRARDRLDKKLATMYERQLRLPSLPQTQALLEGLGFGAVTSHSFAKGYLFYPHECFVAGEFRAPAPAGPEHLRGWWLRERHWEELLALHPGEFRILPKCDWLAPTEDAANVPRTELRGAVESALAEAGPTMFAAVDRDGREVSRGFVVPDDWAPLP